MQSPAAPGVHVSGSNSSHTPLSFRNFFVAQVLLLWDRLLGYDSLELLPILAAAVLVFRADLVMQVSDAPLTSNSNNRPLSRSDSYVCMFSESR